MTLQELKNKMTTQEFNNLVITMLYGEKGEEDISYSMPDTIEEYDPKLNSPRYRELGLTHENFPWKELQIYINQIVLHLMNNLIIPISWKQ